jgi:hypothetical protein
MEHEKLELILDQQTGTNRSFIFGHIRAKRTEISEIGEFIGSITPASPYSVQHGKHELGEPQ